MDINIPELGSYTLKHVVFDLNGTLAVDGQINENIKQKIRRLAAQFHVVIASSDIHNNLASLAQELGVEYHILKSGEIAPQKAAVIRSLGSEETVAVGNGTNDWQMLREAAVGIAVIGREGAGTKAVSNADILVTDAADAMDLLLEPVRLIATLRC